MDAKEQAKKIELLIKETYAGMAAYLMQLRLKMHLPEKEYEKIMDILGKELTEKDMEYFSSDEESEIKAKNGLKIEFMVRSVFEKAIQEGWLELENHSSFHNAEGETVH